jgi:hypothetical protein
MSERKDGLISYTLVGRFLDNSIFFQPLNDSVPQTLGFIETLALMRLCERAGSIPVCTIRTRLENGKPMHHVGFFNEPATPLDEMARDNALLRIEAGRRGTTAEVLIEDAAVCAGLNIQLGGTE